MIMVTVKSTLTSVTLALVALASSAFAATIPDGMQWGVTFGFYATNGYFGSVEAKVEIDAIARSGATWVTVVPTVWQDTCSSSFQYKDFALTPNDIELMDAIDLIHAKGMKVQLRPMLECKDGIGRLGVWMIPDRERMPGRATRERAKWFASMAARSAYYARIAERTKCEAFCLDSELDRMVEENDKWKAVIAAVRGVYSGPVTSCHTLHTGVVDFKKCLANRNHWFHSLDYLTISYYCPARTKADKGKVLSVEEMAARLKGAHARMSAIAQATGKPIVFGECGCASIKDGAASPSGLDVEAEPDEDEQAMYMEALFRVFAHETWCRGFHWWKWDQHSSRREGVTREQVRARDFTFRGKKAEAVFKRWADAERRRAR